jgi:hypothetical protein
MIHRRVFLSFMAAEPCHVQTGHVQKGRVQTFEQPRPFVLFFVRSPTARVLVLKDLRLARALR